MDDSHEGSHQCEAKTEGRPDPLNPKPIVSTLPGVLESSFANRQQPKIPNRFPTCPGQFKWSYQAI
jgi:hypothetical protein